MPPALASRKRGVSCVICYRYLGRPLHLGPEGTLSIPPERTAATIFTTRRAANAAIKRSLETEWKASPKKVEFVVRPVKLP